MSLLHRPRVLQVFPPARQPARAVDRIGIEWLVSRGSAHRAAPAINATGPDCRLELTLRFDGELPVGVAGSTRITGATVEVIDPATGRRVALAEGVGVRGCVSIDAAGWLRWGAWATTPVLGIDPAADGLLLAEGMRAGRVEGGGAPSGPLYVRTGILGALGIPGGRYEVLGLRLGAAESALQE